MTELEEKIWNMVWEWGKMLDPQPNEFALRLLMEKIHSLMKDEALELFNNWLEENHKTFVLPDRVLEEYIKWED